VAVAAGLLVEVEVEELVFQEEQVVPLQMLELMGVVHLDLAEAQVQKQSEELVVLVVRRQVVAGMEEIHHKLLKQGRGLTTRVGEVLDLMDMRLYQ
jgi:hypothetical protein